MKKKKKGLLGRLFAKDQPESAKAEPAKPEKIPVEHPEPGPPEMSSEWVDKKTHSRPVPAPTEPTPAPPPGEEHPHISPGPPEATFYPPADPRRDKSSSGNAAKQAGQNPEAKTSWLQRLTSGLKRTSDQLSNNISAVFTKRKLDATTLEDLEDVLIQADLGADVAALIAQTLAKERFDKTISSDEVRAVLADEVERVLTPVALPLQIDIEQKPFVILMVGVNGSGKTTTIGKMAQKFANDGFKVMLAAGDTFRAAAIEQLQIWGQRTGAPVIVRAPGADASGLAYDAVNEAKQQKADILIIDSAGRLQNRDELMAELEKIIRVIKKVDQSAPHAVLLTLDATTGQNALQQVEIFGKRAGVTGLVMTKLDGTARGGILVAIAKKHDIPVHFIGIGEDVDDLEPFKAADFAAAIAGKEYAGIKKA